MIKDLNVTTKSRDELLAVLKYYIRNIEIPASNVLQVRVSWAAGTIDEYNNHNGHLVGTVWPYPYD